MGGEKPIPLSVCRRAVYDRGRTATGGLGPSRTRQRLVVAALPLYRCDRRYRDFSRFPGLPEW